MKYQGLVVFDVDGTLIREQTVCELIAAKIDRVEQMAWLEANAGSSSESTAAPGNESLIAAREEMVDWYMEAGRLQVDSFFDSVIWADSAHSGVQSLIDRDWLVAIASMTWSFAVDRIADDLGIELSTATTLDWETKAIDHVFPEDKATFTKRVAGGYQIPRDRVFGVGDSGGDIPMLEAATNGIYIGASDPQIPGTIHLPNAGIGTIASAILDS